MARAFSPVGELAVLPGKCKRRGCPGGKIQIVAYRKPKHIASAVYAKCLECGTTWDVCGVPVKRTNAETGEETRRPCLNRPVDGKFRCKYHGGCSRSGPDHHWYRGGIGYSKHLPHNLLAAYETAMHDPELTSVRTEISLVYSRLDQIVKQLSSGESPHAWNELRATVKQLLAALKDGDREEASACVAQLDAITRRKNRVEQLWDEVLKLSAAKMRLSEHEDNRRIQLEQHYTPEQGIQFIKMVAAAVEAEVGDADTRRKIGDRLMALLEAERSGYKGCVMPVALLPAAEPVKIAEPVAENEPGVTIIPIDPEPPDPAPAG